jgi:hypothetical protein
MLELQVKNSSDACSHGTTDHSPSPCTQEEAAHTVLLHFHANSEVRHNKLIKKLLLSPSINDKYFVYKINPEQRATSHPDSECAPLIGTPDPESGDLGYTRFEEALQAVGKEHVVRQENNENQETWVRFQEVKAYLNEIIGGQYNAEMVQAITKWLEKALAHSLEKGVLPQNFWMKTKRREMILNDRGHASKDELSSLVTWAFKLFSYADEDSGFLTLDSLRKLSNDKIGDLSKIKQFLNDFGRIIPENILKEVSEERHFPYQQRPIFCLEKFIAKMGESGLVDSKYFKIGIGSLCEMAHHIQKLQEIERNLCVTEEAINNDTQFVDKFIKQALKEVDLPGGLFADLICPEGALQVFLSSKVNYTQTPSLVSAELKIAELALKALFRQLPKAIVERSFGIMLNRIIKPHAKVKASAYNENMALKKVWDNLDDQGKAKRLEKDKVFIDFVKQHFPMEGRISLAGKNLATIIKEKFLNSIEKEIIVELKKFMKIAAPRLMKNIIISYQNEGIKYLEKAANLIMAHGQLRYLFNLQETSTGVSVESSTEASKKKWVLADFIDEVSVKGTNGKKIDNNFYYHLLSKINGISNGINYSDKRDKKLSLLSHKLACFILVSLQDKSSKLKRTLDPGQQREIIKQFGSNLKDIREMRLEWGDNLYNQLTPAFKECFLQDSAALSSLTVADQFKEDFKRGHTFSVQQKVNGQYVWISSDAHPTETGNALQVLYQHVFENNEKNFTNESPEETTLRTERDVNAITNHLCQTPINKINRLINMKGGNKNGVMESPFKYKEGLSWMVGGGSSHHTYITVLPTGAYMFNHLAKITPVQKMTLIEESKEEGVIDSSFVTTESFDLKKTFASYTWSAYINMHDDINSNDHTIIMTTPLDIQYRLAEISSQPRFAFIRTLIRGLFAETILPVFEYIVATFSRARPS